MLSFEKEEPSTERLNMPATMDTTDATMEDLLAKTTNLTVLDEDGWEINMAGGTEVASLCAMGRFCSNRPISRSLLRTILGRVWGIANRNWGVEIKHTIKEANLDRILTKNPWFLNNGLLIVERMTEMSINWDKVLTKFPLSGRILNLPTSSITQGNLNRLAGFAGDTIEVQKADLPKIVTKEGKGISTSPIQRPPPQRTPPIPPCFYEKKSYSCNSMADMGGQSIAVGSSSMARPESTSSKIMNPTTNPTI
ncbi:hypothetical protein F8388_012654 [Cannabis sativa]|uniref:DUF4283 domain-containing protein n=1 Tax=Cannabis sativa TaxID=3483 RepID=A0A7J6HC51_CANSA|nr:hypothetical protein F8388_012654 [Cannabis sativa]